MPHPALPELLEERVRRLSPHPPEEGDYVVYWMRTAVRAHENPALDTALLAGRSLGLPVFVYHALSERYPFASDRHHTFILEGAMDVEAELAERGVGYCFHLERPGHRGAHLKRLGDRAALVVTEEMPVPPLQQWTNRLAGSVRAPVWAVDTACVVPMRTVPPEHVDRAYRFRKATALDRHARLSRGWNDVPGEGPPFLPDLPFEPVSPGAADIPALVAECAIDHTVGPVPHTRGGSGAGYARWQSFRDGGLARYHRDRNDALRDGVSRMSAYLHYGHVSPFRIAREAKASGQAGADKYLDELLVWRELAWAFCFHHRDLESVSILPGWARRTLREHESDSRPALLSWERLARARTGDALWDAAQTSLVVHGELHNNVRMTWGKAIPRWTPDTERALELLVDLNHRFALDGRDPSSYGGLLWCLGLFDRPFRPGSGILGEVRGRSTKRHAQRLDVGRYAARVARPAVERAPRVAVIGAGVAGLTCARALSDHGFPVRVFDKGRRPGGRSNTRQHGDRTFDHGAQYFTARDPRFRLRVESWVHDGVVAPWEGTIARFSADGSVRPARESARFVGVPGMQSLAAHLAADLDVRTAVRVGAIDRDGDKWVLTDADGEGLGEFDAVVVAVPAPQAVPLLEAAPGLADRARQVRMDPCWAVLVDFEGPVEADFDAALLQGGPLAWVSADAIRPGRPAGHRWTLHASHDWSRKHVEAKPDAVAGALLEAFRTRIGALPAPAFVRAHLWRYALPVEPLAGPALYAPALGIGVCGDWCAGPRIEGAYLSGAALAGRILGDPPRGPAVSADGQVGLFDEPASAAAGPTSRSGPNG